MSSQKHWRTCPLAMYFLFLVERGAQMSRVDKLPKALDKHVGSPRIFLFLLRCVHKWAALISCQNHWKTCRPTMRFFVFVGGGGAAQLSRVDKLPPTPENMSDDHLFVIFVERGAHMRLFHMLPEAPREYVGSLCFCLDFVERGAQIRLVGPMTQTPQSIHVHHKTVRET